MEDEKRVTPRILFDSPVRYHEKGTHLYNNTVGKNISNSGIGFVSNEFIPKNSKLVLEILPPWRPEPIEALAEIVWVSSQPYSERFNVGARFLAPL